MPSLAEYVERIKRAERAKLADSEAAAMIVEQAARAGVGAAETTLNERKAALAAIEAQPLGDLPDDDKLIAERLTTEGVARIKVARAENGLETARAAHAAAEAALAAERKAQAAAIRESGPLRDRIVTNFDNAFPVHAKALFDLITKALAIETEASPRAGQTPKPAPEFEPSLPGSATLRIELLDAGGAVLWRGDQRTNSTSVTRD